MTDTSWQKVGGWYNKLVGEKGHYYHEHVVMPKVLGLMNLKGTESILDLACGQGILSRQIPEKNIYVGVDLAEEMIVTAKGLDKNPNHEYMTGDITKELNLTQKFDWVTIILALQNLENPFGAIKNASNLLKDKGKLLLVINHPCFRIPKNSDWQTDRTKGIQYRKIGSYMSPLKIPIESSPFDKKNNQITWSYHNPLSVYSKMLTDNGLVIENIEEWVSDKKSTGPMAKVEDKARREFPLFMVIVAGKICR